MRTENRANKSGHSGSQWPPRCTIGAGSPKWTGALAIPPPNPQGRDGWWDRKKHRPAGVDSPEAGGTHGPRQPQQMPGRCSHPTPAKNRMTRSVGVAVTRSVSTAERGEPMNLRIIAVRLERRYSELWRWPRAFGATANEICVRRAAFHEHPSKHRASRPSRRTRRWPMRSGCCPSSNAAMILWCGPYSRRAARRSLGGRRRARRRA
eukprot:scaffold1854_cov113-Isochrysis_galbana.AAC.2